MHLLLRYRRATSAVAWLFAAWWLPYVGVTLYLMFGVYGDPRTIRRRRARAAQLRGPDRSVALVPAGYPPDSGTEKLRALSDRVNPFPLAGGNSVEMIGDGDEAYGRMFETIDAARAEICLGTYILAEGAVATRLRDLLVAKAQAGVTVRLLFDHFGSFRLSRSWLEKAAAGGVTFAGFLKPSPLRGRLQINFRNHRKILVADGAVAVTGGQNWEDEHSRTMRKGRGIRDFNVLVRGPAVGAIRRVFLEDWCIASGSEEDPGALEPRFSVPGDAGDTHVRVVTHGPDEERQSSYELATCALHEARRDILVVTPFFVPGEPMRDALGQAALSGVRVRLLVPHRSDHAVADLAARRVFGPLLECGVEVRLFHGPFLHAKALSIDDSWAVVGSSNFDYRSFYSNYEMDLEVADAAFARALREHFEPDLANAELLDPALFARRSVWARALANAAALFEPLL